MIFNKRKKNAKAADAKPVNDNAKAVNNADDNTNESLKYIVPAIVGAGAGAAWLLKKIRNRGAEVVTVTAEPSEYDPADIKEYIAENICVEEITEENWMMGGAKLLFAAIEANFNDMVKKNDVEVDSPVWHGYIAKTEGTGKYILKAAKESTEDIYMFWEEKTGFIFALHEGLDYLMQLECGLTDEDYEKQGVKYMNYMGLLEVLIGKFDIELDEETDVEDVLEENILKTYFELNPAK